MNFANYSEFRTRVQQLIDGDDVSVSDLSGDILDLMIATAEQRIYRDVRSSTMDTALSLTVTANVATLPTDLVQLKIAYFSGYAPLQLVTYEQYLTKVSENVPTGTVKFAAQQGDTLVFWPAASGTLLGRYYKRFTDIAGGITSNTLFARHPDLFLYASLSELSGFLGDQKSLQVYEAKYQVCRTLANSDETRLTYGGSTLQVRVA